jgi:LmbE family N-acetylglucosaminyl deacetylase
MNVLVMAPHPDDEALGCGGTIALHAARGDRVAAVFLTSGELGLRHLPREEAWRVREQEAAAAAAILGVRGLTFLHRPDWFLEKEVAQAAAGLWPVVEREAPDRIYLPHGREGHGDHRACGPILRAALAGYRGRLPEVFTYEVWTPLEEYDLAEDISAVMKVKLQAVRCYQSQLTAFRYDRAIRGLNQYRGAMAGRCRYAEVFRSSDHDSLGTEVT